ncbi:MAG: abortive infection protein [Pseudanabaena frigida]|uniref:Abortive infection protein n=1 Tax=Pseudanabaena frigida TaxID=945775 RepID=A0A2W4W2U1_9CYAN|nr:MAG: abortive infection protein [Pseudanabaena frigida]
MLIEFRVGNYRSFKEIATFSMVAANIVSKDKSLDENNVFTVDDDLTLLKTAAIYGANASGKSNLAKALGFMRWFIINSSKDTQTSEQIEVERFKLSDSTDSEPSFFEIVFFMNQKKYRYGFEANRNEVVSEWLFYVPKLRETKLFERKAGSFTIAKIYKADGIQQKTRSNALFLSVSAQFNVGIAESILTFFGKNINLISGLDDEGYHGYTIKCLQDNKNRDSILNFLKNLSLGFDDIQLEEHDINVESLPREIPDEIKRFILKNSDGGKATSVQTLHKKFNEEGVFISSELFDINDESEGTQKIFSLAGPFLDTLKNGKVLIIDEFDARLHPKLSLAIVEMFNSRDVNPNNAQLVFMTHDTNLLSNKLFRRDQVWFTEKNRYGSTSVYSLVEYKVRNDASFESDYIKGKYGAIPYIRSLNNLVDANG